MSKYIRRELTNSIKQRLKPNKVLVIYGPRQVGKTTLIKHFLRDKKNYLYVDGEDIFIQETLSSQSIEKLKSFVANNDLIVIDEAQKIPNIGTNLKLLVDHFPGLNIIATGSSSFDLAQKIGEPLTGRKITLRLYPLAQLELAEEETITQTQARLEERLIYGSYPEIITMHDNKDRKDYLMELVNSYLYKDLLSLDGLKHASKIKKILQLLALQIGKEVSISELATTVELSKNTVQRYIDLLEKAFVLMPLRGLSRNLRKEVSKMPKYYFYDVGVRNALINQFNPLSVRQDIGDLWENYLIIERIKKLSYNRIHKNTYFWRTYDQQEIDWIEEEDGILNAYEFKWQSKKRVKVPTSWSNTYPDSTFKIISKDNYLDFI